MAIRIQLRRDTKENWERVNPILAQGEVGVQQDSGLSKIKIGNNIDRWNDLEFLSSDIPEEILASLNKLDTYKTVMNNRIFG